ncbi:MAG: HAMP domain-containing sensor histidine kinase [Cyanobacteria bacterium P01_B01_bin.77]
MYTAMPASHHSETSFADIRQLCQSQLDRLSKKLPILDVWLVWWNQLENRHDVLSYCRNQQPVAEFRPYLESERWISQNLSCLELISLSLNNGDNGESQAYVCGLGKTDAHWDYLLLWTKQHISRFQQDLVKEYAQLLQHYLTLYQENLRQRAKVQLLEQALQQAEHQLRNPLSLIRLYAETIVLGAENEGQKQQADCICQTADEISSNLGSLLNCSQQANLHPEDHNLLTLLETVVVLLKPSLEQKNLTVVMPNTPIFLTIDGWQFEQVLQNLLDNAVRMSPLGGAITVDWQLSPHAILITVSDQGPGLDDVDIEKLFDPFYSKRPGGSGLGLAIAKKIILDHQGSIGAETLHRGGAQFSIFLPR